MRRGSNRLWETEGIFEGEMSFKPNKIRVIEFGYINSLKLSGRNKANKSKIPITPCYKLPLLKSSNPPIIAPKSE
jgi:hypothetical protein